MTIFDYPDAKTELYCVFGNPVSHSKSPIIHNALFKQNKINAIYLAFNINDIKVGVQAVRELNIKGVSVTIPFKEKIIAFLDDIDSRAKEIGAVNTIVNQNGKLKGYNTDWAGSVKPLKKYNVKNKKVGLIGAGGSAHAVAYGIKKSFGKLTIINRTRKNGEKLASLFNADFILMDRVNNENFDILINTTPLGMSPDIKSTPFLKQYLNKDTIVMDIVYNPVETQLIKDARNIGCKTIDGISMFINQGALQFQLWTDIEPSIEFMRSVLEKEMVR